MDRPHLNALEFRLSNERVRLANSKTDKERASRSVWVAQCEKEIAQEREFLGLPAEVVTDASDAALLAELGL
jgi:hypothetical protein